MNPTASQAIAALKRRGWTCAACESLTGGLICATLVDVPGASAVLMESHVTYSNEAKMRLLGVREQTLKAYGAVSEQCAREMAEGCRRISGADYALSTTGIAGPDGGTPAKPVGTVYVACASEKGTTVLPLRLRGDRTRVRQMSCLYALNLLRLEMNK